MRWFGLADAIGRGGDETRGQPSAAIALDFAPGSITLVTGPSGAGKSSLLRDVRCGHQRSGPNASDHLEPAWIDLASVALRDVPIVDCFEDDAAGPDATLRRALLGLARVGLGEAWTYLRTPAELSDGQRWRLRLAIALDRASRTTVTHVDNQHVDDDNADVVDDAAGRPILIADEFAALLDRVTACVVARSLRRAITSGSRVAALVATSHHDLTRALAPDVVVHCDFGRFRTVKSPTISNSPAARGVAEATARETNATPSPAPLGPRSHKRRPGTGGSMRKIIVTSLAAASLSLSTSALRTAAADNDVRTRAPVAVDPRAGNDRLLLAPSSPLEPPRSPFQLDPRAPRRDALYPSVERELDRGNGRIESDLDFDARRWQREQDERLGITEPQRELDRFEEERDRTLRIETQQRRADVDRRSQQVLESESQRLAAERERFYRSAGIDVTGAAHDTWQLRNLERAYQRDVKQLRRDRSAELKRLEKRDDLKGDARRAARAAIDERYRAAQTERRERYSTERGRVMGTR